MKKQTLPKVKIEEIELQENNYVNYGKTWSAIKLIEHSKRYPVFEIPLAGLDLTRTAWEIQDLDDFIFHIKRTKDTDLKYPIILDHCGVVADGIHRIAKAIVLGNRTIKAIRLETMPEPDSFQNKKQ